MTVWEFRRLVRARRAYCETGFCPLGAALMGQLNPRPIPAVAERALKMEYGYCLAVVSGFDYGGVPSDLPSHPVFDAGERYGKRMRRVAELRRWERLP